MEGESQEASAQINRLEADPDFKALGKDRGVFCPPFEALGMIHQEIRHSNFLAYCLDPSKPHGFSGRMLRAFLDLVNDKMCYGLTDLPASLCQVEVLREWNHIDLFIRIPGKPERIVAVEQKIRASEGAGGQLTRYRELLAREFSEATRTLIFLTVEGDAPPIEGEAKYWSALSLRDVVNVFASVAKASPNADGTGLFLQYEQMLKRYIMLDPEVDARIRKLWRSHGAALELLMEHRPDLEREIADVLRKRPERLAVELETGGEVLRFQDGASSLRHLRFAVDTWQASHAWTMGGVAVGSRRMTCC